MRSPASTSNLRRFLALSSSERRLLFEAWWCLLAAAMRLRLAPRRAVAMALVESRCAGQVGEAAGTAPSHVALAVSRAAVHHLQPMTCLPRALALQRMLRARGIAAQLRIGVRKDSTAVGGIAAHAWVEVDGMALGEPEAIAERFQPFLPPLIGPSSVRCEEHGETHRK